MSDLMLHAGGYAATWTQVLDTPTPDATATFTPLPHYWMVEQLVSALNNRGYDITRQQYGLMGPHGEDLFGVIHLNHPSPTNDYAHVLGFRNSHRHRFAGAGFLGTSVFVCDNLAFRGANAQFQFSRKHTTNIRRDFPLLCADKMNLLPSLFADTVEQIENWKETTTTRANKAHIMMRCLEQGALNTQQVRSVWHEATRADGPGGHASLKGNNLWSLYNAFTEVEKLSTSPAASQMRTSRLTTILDGECRVVHADDDHLTPSLFFNDDIT